MSQISAEEVKNLYALARLPLSDEMVSARQKDLEEILGYVASLGRLDTSSAKEVHGGTDFLNSFRKDESLPESAEIRANVIRSFPTSEADLNKVLSILGK